MRGRVNDPDAIIQCQLNDFPYNRGNGPAGTLYEFFQFGVQFRSYSHQYDYGEQLRFFVQLHLSRCATPRIMPQKMATATAITNHGSSYKGFMVSLEAH